MGEGGRVIRGRCACFKEFELKRWDVKTKGEGLRGRVVRAGLDCYRPRVDKAAVDVGDSVLRKHGHGAGVRTEADAAARHSLTVGVSGEHSEAVRVHCTPG